MFAIGLPVALFVTFADPDRLMSEWFGPPQDGAWIAETLDGERPANRYTLGIRWGRIIGGYDGCNHWSYVESDGDVARMTTLMACDPRPDIAYGAVAIDPKVTMLGEDRMRLEARGHVATFRRMTDAELETP